MENSIGVLLEVGSFGVGIERWNLELALLEIGVVFEVGVDI